ncbi:BppU family phage baseplate upper protein [Bacillus sp. CDB3]|uniref:BppU family phage baseplate upper protein n=1 Tax=Bacillus sp. CDB3 TaxID=360310 RepID=UPI0015C4AEBF|nr:BppU family phage baseplate upper protein [Bacillus sp. CDB3]
MTFKTREITVDLVNDVSIPNIRFSQGDENSAKLILNLTNQGQELDLSKAKAVRITFKKPDGKTVFQEDCQPINAMKGKYQIILKTQTLAAAGNVLGQVRIIEPDGKLDAEPFGFYVKKSFSGDEAIESTDQFPIIEQAIAAGKKLEGKDIDGIIAAGAKADTAIDQIGILSGNVVEAKDRLNIGVAKKTNRRPLISFIDDDGNIKVYTLLYELMKELKFKLTSCVITGTVGTSQNQVTEAQLKEMHDSGLLEITSHTHDHAYLTKLSETERYNNLKQSKKWLRARGYADDILVYPYGDMNEAVRNTSQKLFRAAVNIDDTTHKINYPALKTFALDRVYVDYGIDLAKQKIDEAIANNGWVIFGMHCHYPDFDINVVRQIVEYARLKGVEIVSVTEGLNAMGNIVEIGDSYEKGKPNTFVIDCDGVTYGNDSPQVVYRSGITNNSVPTDFPINKSTITTIGTTNTAGFPTGSGGVVITHLYGTEKSFPWTYQEWYPIASNDKYIRYWDRHTTAWSAWKNASIKFNTSGTNAYTNSSLITDFPAGEVTVTIINATGSNGFPNNKSGTLTTYRFSDAWARQEYKVHQSNDVYQRYINSSGVWSAWELINRMEYLGIDALTVNTLMSDNVIPSGKVSYTQIGSSGTTGFPVEFGGMLFTNKLYPSSGYQEFTPNASQTTKYIRRWNGSAWTEWLRVGGGTGTTAQRPNSAYVGYMYFDTTLGKAIWLKTTPSTWVDASGTTV